MANATPTRHLTIPASEVKCYGLVKQIGMILDYEEQHVLQVQGGMWVCEREWCDRVSYHPDMPIIVRVERDDKIIARIAEAVSEFNERLEDAKARMIALGYRPVERAPVNGNAELPPLDIPFPSAIPPEASCKARMQDGRWCMSRDGLVEIGGQWLCRKHALPEAIDAAFAGVF